MTWIIKYEVIKLILKLTSKKFLYIEINTYLFINIYPINKERRKEKD